MNQILKKLHSWFISKLCNESMTLCNDIKSEHHVPAYSVIWQVIKNI